MSLTFFSVFCALNGYLIVRSKFLPSVLGWLMLAAGVCYWLKSFGLFLALPNIPYLSKVTLVAESALALWLVVFGVNEEQWRRRAKGLPTAV